MLKTILSITGKPGLFKLISQGRNMLLVEDLLSHKRYPAHSRDRLVSLGDIAIYTDAEEKPLGEVLDAVYAKQEGKPIDIKELENAGTLRSYFGEILPDFDEDRVYNSDIKKLMQWYNLLLEAGFTKFTADEEAAEETAEEEPAKED